MKLWDKRGVELKREIEDFAVGNETQVDQAIVYYDCIASIAHARMLQKIGVLTSQELSKVVHALEELVSIDRQGSFRIKKEEEDCHTAIENYLTEKLGDIGKKIHAGRSRNDQVAAALRLYEKEQLVRVKSSVSLLLSSLKLFQKKNAKVSIPGYTHLRKAMPFSVGGWAQAFIESLQDDLILLENAAKLVDQNPLGSGAGYGVPVISLDRKLTAKELGFAKVQESPLYVQNSRGKFELVILDAINYVMLDLNKLASDIWLYTSEEFGFFQLPKEFSMGSSMMPQKANPDVIELLRAKASVVAGYREMISRIIQGLPSGYHGDFKLTKEPLMRAFDETAASLKVSTLIMSGLVVNEKRCRAAMTQELYATGKALQLVKKGVPFRDAYKRVARDLSNR